MGIFSWLFGRKKRRSKTIPDWLTKRSKKIVERNIRAHEAGKVRGKHYGGYTNDVKRLMRRKEFVEAEKLLRQLVDAIEAQNRIDRMGPPPWCYEQLAIVYRSQKNYSAEISILRRYLRQDRPSDRAKASFRKRIERAEYLSKKT